MRDTTLLALLVSLLCGCGETGHWMSFEPKPVDSNVYPADYKTQLLDLMRTYLSDPTGVRDAYLSEPVLIPSGNYFIVCLRYNAKIDGKYLGITNKMATYLGGRINQFIDPQPDQCTNAAYQPFPELEHLKPLGK
jgi:hypothetical protein